MFARIARGKFQIPASTNLSLDAKILLRSLIRVKPDERLLPEEILGHNWFRQYEHEQSSGRYVSASSSSPLSSSLNTSLLNESKYLNKVNIGISLNSSNLNRFSLLQQALSTSANGSQSTNVINENNFIALKSTTTTTSESNNTNNASGQANNDDNNDDCIVPEFKN
jgi:hypothetical protein